MSLRFRLLYLAETTQGSNRSNAPENPARDVSQDPALFRVAFKVDDGTSIPSLKKQPPELSKAAS
jgi:hypothetical protein